MNATENNSKFTQSLRVLYIEDEPETLQELSRFLKKRVSSLMTASNGFEALALCKKHTIDVIITDIRMPQMDGLVFLQHLRQQGNHCPVIITSAFSDTDTLLHAVDLGIVKYCVKPLNTDHLMIALSKIGEDLLKQQGALILPKEILLDRDSKLEYEKRLRSEGAHMLKTLTGKGPKDVQVVLGASEVELTFRGVLTPLELALLDNPNNLGLIAYLRKTFYLEKKQDFEKTVEVLLGVTAQLTNISTLPAQQSDTLIFSLRSLL